MDRRLPLADVPLRPSVRGADPDADQTYLIIEAQGFGKSVIGRLFAKIYSKSLDRAIPMLVEEMNGREGLGTNEARTD